MPAKKANSHSKPKSKLPRQDALPGMENAKIKAIEDAAMDYAEIRDQRQELTIQEVDLKTKLLDLMHKNGKTEYKRGNISISIIPEGEKVKVRVREEAELPTSSVEVEATA